MHLISGNVGVGGAVLSYVDGGAKTATINSYGNYSLMVSNHWSGTVSVAKAGYVFTPASTAYEDVQVDQNNQNYTASVTTYAISGNTGIDGVTLSYTNGTSMTVTSDSNGNYSLNVPYNWSGTVTPSKIGSVFSPASRTYSAVRADQSNQDYGPVITVSGNASRSGVTLSYTDGTAKTVTSDSSGNYSLNVASNWSGTITPSLPGYTFTPSNRSYTNLLANQTAQDFAATAIIYTISGNVGVGGATLSYTDGTPKTTIANENGDYSFTVSYNWSGTVTPSKSGYVFNPSSKSYSFTTADKPAQNYTATVGTVI